MIEERWAKVQSKPLAKGSHGSLDEGVCVMELVSYIAREPFSDHPVCVSPAIAAFLRSWNDSLDGERRQMLKPYALKVIGTNTGPADEERRAWMATDWLVREFTPAWLDLAKLPEHAQKLRALPALETAALANEAIATIHAAWATARVAAWATAWATARDAAWAAAWAAAGAAARDAAGAAAWAAARDAAGDAARDAAGAAAWDAAWAAAGAAARDAARDAAGAALAPTVLALQESALRLLDRMIAVGKTEIVS